MNPLRLSRRPYLHLLRVVRNGNGAQLARPGAAAACGPRTQTQALHIEKCPEPTCECAPMPQGLDIDHKSQLQGTVAMHNKLIVVSSGRSDWPSKIEETEDEPIICALKEQTSIKGQYHNPYFSSMITASSFGWAKSKKRSIMVFPDGHHVHSILPEHLEDFIQGYVLPDEKSLSLSLGRRTLPDDANPPMQEDWARANMEAQKNPISKVIVFICGHAQRDSRCGVLGPLLQEEFEHQFRNHNIPCLSEPEPYMDAGLTASVGLISHIGGHKFAGNVIVYLPKSHHVPDMAGRCIWYGRVEPKHVEGIVKETVLKGTVIRELLRGGMESDGRMLNMADFQPIE